jgi:transposase
VVGALQAVRGVAAITAIGLAAEIGDLELVPSEHSSGERTIRNESMALLHPAS